MMSSSARGNGGGEGPPRVYEEIIQNLEAEVRKHIRVSEVLFSK